MIMASHLDEITFGGGDGDVHPVYIIAKGIMVRMEHIKDVGFQQSAMPLRLW